MRITLLSCVLLASMATTATAQTTYVGPWRPRPTIGGAFGKLSAGESSGTWNPVVSGTLEIPLTEHGRMRIEAGRGAFPISFTANNSRQGETARLSRITIGGSGLFKPGAPVSPYLGFNFGAYRLSLDGAGKVTSGGHIYYGIEFGSDLLSVAPEFGLHLIDKNPFNERLFAEIALRIKVGL